MKKQTTYRLTGAQLKARTAQPRTSFRRQLLAATIVLPLATAAALVTWFDTPTTATNTYQTPYSTEVVEPVIDPTVNHISQAELKAAEAPAPKEQEVAQTDALGEWAARAHDAEQAHQDRCWDQLEERGYGDASCY